LNSASTALSAANHRVLVIDDTESIHQDFRKILAARSDAALDDDEAAIFGEPSAQTARKSQAFEIDSAMQGQEGFEMVRSAVESGRPYAVAFVDMRMPPGWDGLKTIEHLWKIDPSLQVVICSAYSDHSWHQIIDRIGMSDRLLILKKPFDAAEVSQLAIALAQKWQATRQAMVKLDELESLVQSRTLELRHAATHDRLTGLPNRAGLGERLTAMLAQQKRQPRGYAVLFLDFDRFKIINDSLGHEVGDGLLVGIAQRLREALDKLHPGCGPDDSRNGEVSWIASRLGGDEFVVLIEGLPGIDGATQLADALLRDLRPSFNVLGHEVYVTASIGITSSDIGYDAPAPILRDADAAMYRAKMSGRDCWSVFDSSMHQQLMARMQTEVDLRRAVERNEFRLVYQPIVAIDTGILVGAEALLRWDHPTRGTVGPNEFIPLLEEMGIIIPVGQWVIQTALNQLRTWSDANGGKAPLYLAVNISKRQLLIPGLVEQIAQMLEQTGVPPKNLKLEVTESMVMEKAEIITPVLRKLRELGLSLAMDDFGTGHSSLNCLHRFPIQTLKIDRAFVSNLGRSMQYTAVIQAIVTLAKNLGMDIVVEGVETPGQLAQVQEMECDYGQGYLFSKPVSPEDLIAMLSKRQWGPQRPLADVA
jgi:diguanylate cyclase